MVDQRQSSSASGANTGWAVVGTLMAGIIVWGGIGWLADLALGTSFIKAIGVVVGVVASIYLVLKKFT